MGNTVSVQERVPLTTQKYAPYSPAQPDPQPDDIFEGKPPLDYLIEKDVQTIKGFANSMIGGNQMYTAIE